MRILDVKGNSLTLSPTKLVCLGRNYRKHAEEFGSEVPKKPIIFLKPPSSIIIEGEKIVLPRQSKNVHHEVELGIVIGKKGKDVSKKIAGDHIFGYCIFLDITARDLQEEETRRAVPWTLSKGFDTFAPVSRIVRKEEIKDPTNLGIRLWVNGALRQESNTRHMIFGIEELVEYISSHMTLERGDIIATGTPEGVGQIKSGDVLEAEIEGIGKVRFEVE